MEHFGIKLKKHKYSFELRKEEFAIINTKPSLPVFDNLIEENAYSDNTYTQYDLKWCENYRILCLENYDINMNYFNSLDSNEFNNALEDYLKSHSQFHEIVNIVEYKGVEGYYIIVLDKYKQVYIGKTNNIKKRIHDHWINTKSFDRILFPMYDVKKSIFSIDFFRALDTTRIFVWEESLYYGMERKLIEDFPKKFCCNRVGGDVYIDIEALATKVEHFSCIACG